MPPKKTATIDNMLGIEQGTNLNIINDHIVGENMLINCERVLPQELEIIY
jgi:hypothetical protein